MKQKHTTRRSRQAVRRQIEQRVQDLEQRLLPRRAALALLKMRQACVTRPTLVRSRSGEKEARA